jgi:hypothetical protein
MLNFCSVPTSGNDATAKSIMRYLAFTMSVLSEYLVCGSERIQSAAFSGIRLIIQHGLKPKFFKPEQVKSDQKSKN